MKKLALILAPILTVGLGTAFATTTDSLELTLGTLTATIADNGSCVGTGCTHILGDLDPTDGTDTIGGSIGNWTIHVVSGTSNSPSDVPEGLDISSFTATCSTTCATANLHVLYSDINFSPANPEFLTQYSATISGSGGSTSESAYYSNTNTLFAETTLIGKVGPFTATNSGVATGGTGSIAPYSLTLDEVFNAGSSSISFSVDGSVSSVPEPSAVMLFGAVLFGCGAALRRRKVQ